MAILYFAFAIILIICNITEIPAAIKVIVTAAFTPKAVTGGAVGSMFVAMQKGVARGIFSNEAGLGSAPIAAAAAQTKEPVRQGLVSMTGTFIDTIIICSLTGLSLLVSGEWMAKGSTSTLTQDTFTGVFGPVGGIILTLCLVLFATTTILGWSYYGERCFEFLFGVKHINLYRIFFVLMVGLGGFLKLDLVWVIADIVNGLMALPNLIALLALSPVIIKESKLYFKK